MTATRQKRNLGRTTAALALFLLVGAAHVEAQSPPASQVDLLIKNGHVVDGTGAHVATVDQNHKVHLQPVKVGKDFGKELEITEGLVGNERLVSNPTDELTEGTKVRVSSERR